MTAGAVEAAAAIGSGAALVPLSPQSIVDCSGNASVGASARDAGNHGCVGGGIVRGFNYALRNGGVATEEAYPDRLEENAPGNCSYARADVAGRISGYVNVSANATLLRYAVAQNPVATAVDAHHRSFLFYESGVYRSAECTQEVTHGVLVVGYGTDDDGTPYFVLKNSWSEFWGDDGYMRIAATPEGCAASAARRTSLCCRCMALISRASAIFYRRTTMPSSATKQRQPAHSLLGSCTTIRRKSFSGATIISCFFVRMRRKVRSFCGSRSRTAERAFVPKEPMWVAYIAVSSWLSCRRGSACPPRRR